MNQRRNTGQNLLLFGLFLMVASTGICTAAQPIRIGLSFGLTGRYAAIGKMQERAFRLWESRVNAGGGILGRGVKLTIHDDKSNAETAKDFLRASSRQKA
jgi:branched-chain amino acid transport system substrate-binding protein